jgi:TonB family protein
MPVKNYYQILQIMPDASTEVINSAYKALADKYHPDSPEGDAMLYNKIKEAYEILINPEKRQEYDKSLNTLANIDLPPVYPEYKPSKMTIQNFINMLYEQITFESVNHNPAKSRVYQEIYDEVIKKRSTIANSDAINNPVWKILKTYEPYLAPDELNNLKLMVSRVFDIPEKEAQKIYGRVEIADIPYNKIITFTLIIFVAAIFGIVGGYLYLNKDSKSLFNPYFAGMSNNDESGTKLNIPEENSVYQAKIFDLGIPVNLRSAPTTEWDNVVSKLSQGTTVNVIKHQPNGWYYISSGENEGYIYGGLLEKNEYPDSFPIAEIKAPEIKVYDKNHKVVKVLKAPERYVVFYHDNEMFYVKSEKGNLFGIEKAFVTLENPQKTFITYIEEHIKDQIEFSAVTAEQVIVEDSSMPEDKTEIDDTDVYLPHENQEISPEHTKIPDNNNLSSEETLPPVIFPGQRETSFKSIQEYTDYIKNDVLNNWTVPQELPDYSSIVVFRVARDGRLLNLKLIKSSGNKTVDNASIRAINDSAPFKPLPENYTNDYVDIKFNFDER